MEKMLLDTTFACWEGSASKDGSGIPSLSFPLGDFRMMFGLLRKMKIEMMVPELFVLFFTVTPELNGGS